MMCERLSCELTHFRHPGGSDTSGNATEANPEKPTETQHISPKGEKKWVG